ncbi:unnamed protein product [Vicia faba]|uniref:Vesicle transport protein n=1 Tax=Vicia faba TaxID=3906 RepID=A0AAV0YNP9_VICFA|nr:unnamed protein product [Vicia faba]
MESWFSSSTSPSDDQQKPASSSSSSLLADWNSYATSQQEQDSSNSAISFDLESAVRSANNTVTGTFSVVSKSVRDIPGNFSSATSNVPSGKALLYFGCGFIIGSFFALKGPKNQLSHMMSKERLPFTLGFLCSMVGTIYVSMVLHSYILSVVFSVVQVLSLGYYAISYFPGGSAGMRFLTSALTSRIMTCFGR